MKKVKCRARQWFQQRLTEKGESSIYVQEATRIGKHTHTHTHTQQQLSTVVFAGGEGGCCGAKDESDRRRSPLAFALTPYLSYHERARAARRAWKERKGEKKRHDQEAAVLKQEFVRNEKLISDRTREKVGSRLIVENDTFLS
jgi:hypothetical protein